MKTLLLILIIYAAGYITAFVIAKLQGSVIDKSMNKEDTYFCAIVAIFSWFYILIYFRYKIAEYFDHKDKGISITKVKEDEDFYPNESL